MFAVVLLPLTLPASPAAAFPCTNYNYRAGTRALNVTVATGVSGVIKTPLSTDVYNYGTNEPSTADIYMWKQGSASFVQVGWYLGSAENLPTATQPRLFWGEYNPSDTNGETLHAGTTLSWGTYYSFAITNPLDGTNRFNIWLQGNIIARSALGHDLNAPGFNGEVDYQCTTMFALASHAQSPLRTLQYRYGSWMYFSGTTFADSGFHSGDIGDIATDFAYGGG